MIARIVDRSRIEISVRIPASSRALAPVGAKVDIVPRDAAARHAGTVVRVAPEDDPASRTATVFVEPATGASPIAPGSFVEAHIAAGGTEPRIAVPRRAIRDEHIAVVEGGRIHMRRVSVDFRYSGTPVGAGVADTDWAVLDDALPAGTLVVLDGSRSLAEGQSVEPVRASATASASGDRR